ncbi:MAG: DUF2971 domain-containing protein [Pseudomonadota bacterium]
MLANLAERLFAEQATETLYHYTSFTGLQGIVSSSILRASDIRYMNDSTELRHTLELLGEAISARIQQGCDNPRLLTQLQEWLSHRVVQGPMLFVASFRANGNLLSQWRGYSIHGKGVSLGFNPEHVADCAERQMYQLGRCIYDEQHQRALMSDILGALENAASGDAPLAVAARESADFHSLFELAEAELLRIAAILKHPSFEEEQEWRIVSPPIRDDKHAPVHFREGKYMLVPYYDFRLAVAGGERMTLEHVFLGPTPNRELSMNSLRLYLEKYGVEPRRGIDYCRIPYRQR